MGLRRKPANKPSEDRATWGFEPGDEITSGRLALVLLGGGRHYEVYLAWDDTLFTQVVVKILRPDRTEKEEALTALRREAGILRSIDHPYLLRCFGASSDGPRPHLVLEHLEGPTLRSLIKKYGPLALEQLIPLALNLCSALHYLGSKEIVHLDVKPANIVLGESPRLVDFSVARTLAGVASISSQVGTSRFMSPEQCRAVGTTIGPKSDVWGLGATLYEAMSGERPFPRQDPTANSKESELPQLLHGPLPPRRRLPPVLVDSVFLCLRHDPSERPGPAELALMLEPLIGALPAPVLRRRRPKLR